MDWAAGWLHHPGALRWLKRGPGACIVRLAYTIAGVAEHIQQKGAKRIVCMCGAGISVSAGIPDFRSPGTGLYDNLERYNLPRPSAVFELDYFRQNPEPFYQLAKVRNSAAHLQYCDESVPHPALAQRLTSGLHKSQMTRVHHCSEITVSVRCWTAFKSHNCSIVSCN